MNQTTFSDLEHQVKQRKTHRELFLERMDGLIPWRTASVPSTPSPDGDVIPTRCRPCCEFTASNSSTT